MLPNLPHFLHKRFTMKSYWAPGYGEPVTYESVKGIILRLFENDTLLASLYLLLAAIAIVPVLYRKDKVLSRKVSDLSVLSTLPLAGVITVSLISPNESLLIRRIIMVFAPPIVVLAAVGLTSIPSKVFTAITLLFSSAISSWWLYSSSYYTVPTKDDFRAVTHEVARLEKDHSNIILISLDREYEASIGFYYWKTLGVRNDVFIVPKDTTADEFLYYIQARAKTSNINRVVLFSQHHPYFRDFLELCDKHFRKVDERVFASFVPGHTFLVSYSLN